MYEDQQTTIRIESARDYQLVHLEGELGLMTAEPVRQALASSITAAQPLVVSLAALTAIDLCGLQLLCSAQRSCQTNSLPFTLRAVPDWFQEIVHTAGFHQHPAFQAAWPDAVQEEICA